MVQPQMTTGLPIRPLPSTRDEVAPVVNALVVDDDPDISRLLQMWLIARGYRVTTASSGEEALEQLDRAVPDLLFLDVLMPGMTGLQVLDLIRDQRPDLAVIMTTAFGSEQVAIDALRRGADDYLRKPIVTKEFQAVLERTVTRLQLNRQNAALRRQLDEERRQLAAELARAGEVQADLLPRSYPVIKGFELSARCVPAREVGGDFYDWQELASGKVTLTLGDVMGKGMPAALLMATTRAAIRGIARQNNPAVALELAEQALQVDLDMAGSYVTLFHAQLDIATRRLLYVDAGHGHVFLRRSNGVVEELQRGGMPLGVPFNQGYDESTLVFEHGDTLVLYSDGLVEGRPGPIPTPAMLAAQLQNDDSAQEVVDRLINSAIGIGPLPDDLTVVVLRCNVGDE
jgi:serine phosphatase RsbU (regulator of sigma subunit)